MPMRDIRKAHPNLAASGGCRKTSNQDPDYNCIAWAAGDTRSWWWPWPHGKGCYWPVEATREATVEAFAEAFGTLGYRACAMDASLDADYEKVAIFALDGRVKHMARQLRSGLWTSKAGMLEDFSHQLAGLDNDPMYGSVTLILRRRRRARRR